MTIIFIYFYQILGNESEIKYEKIAVIKYLSQLSVNVVSII